MTDATIKRRDMLLVASSMLAATAISAMPAASQTQAADKLKTDTDGSSSAPDEPYESPSRGRRAS